jgi:DNA mismatch repair protein MutS2
MLTQTLKILEFDKIVALLVGMSVTSPGRALLERLRPFRPPQEVEQSLVGAQEAAELLEHKGPAPLGGAHDLGVSLHQAGKPGARLSAQELLEVGESIAAARACAEYFCSEELAPHLTECAAEIKVPKDLGRRIERSIDSKAEVLDTASWQLADLRQQQRDVRRKVRNALERMLQNRLLAGAFQDQIITERNGRYVVPVKADHRGHVKGFVHDESASGQTLFIEPEQVLDDNNRLQSLRREEQREIARILEVLTDGVRSETEVLRGNQILLARLDARCAMGRFIRLIGAGVPQLVRKPQLELLQARHPLLLLNQDGTVREHSTVPVDLRLGHKHDTLIISGPNTGGKTVALKTVGLLFLMVSAGIPVPCDPRSKVYLFGKIFADIGDEQSIEGDLSTFSGHLVRMRRILEHADAKSLVLMDEAGTGTDPSEGGALALAVLDQLRERGARTVVTTHLNTIKGYAFLHERVENAAVEFDPATLAPTYRLHYGVPGSSSALTIAGMLGLPAQVIQQAQEYLGSEERDGLAVVERLNHLYAELEAERAETRELLQQAKQEREKRRKLLHEFEGRRDAMRLKAQEQAREIVNEARAKVRSLMKRARELQHDSASGREEAELMREVRKSAEVYEPRRDLRSPHPPRELIRGEVVRIPSLGAEAVVEKVKGEQVDLDLRGKKMRLALHALEAFEPRRFSESKRSKVYHSRSAVERTGFNPDLDVVGLKVDDAVARVERFIDDALLHNWRDLRVTHGRGAGALRSAIREMLGHHRAVSAFHSADSAHGGDAVTVIQLGENSGHRRE